MTFQELKERRIKPPFKYWIMPDGFYRGDFHTFNTIRDAKAKVEELFLESGKDYCIMNVWYSKNPYRIRKIKSGLEKRKIRQGGISKGLDTKQLIWTVVAALAEIA